MFGPPQDTQHPPRTSQSKQKGGVHAFGSARVRPSSEQHPLLRAVLLKRGEVAPLQGSHSCAQLHWIPNGVRKALGRV
jgi:hypothetical protein